MSNDDIDYFSSPAVSASSGISILSDSSVQVHADPSVKGKKQKVEDCITVLEGANDNLSKYISTAKDDLDDVIEALGKIVDYQAEYDEDTTGICTDYDKIAKTQELFETYERVLCQRFSAYITLLSQQAEANRRITALKATKDELSKKESDFSDVKKGSVGSNISIEAETVYMRSTDGDGNLRENPAAGLYVQMPHVTINAHDKDGKLIEDSYLNINTQDFELSTSNPDLKYDDQGKPSGEIKHGEKGSVSIISKDIEVQAIDQKYEGEDLKESALEG